MFRPGGTFGSLRIERELGSGAFGRVWLARDTRLDRPVALKVLHDYGAGPLPAEERARFLREAQIIAGFNHPHVVVLYHLHSAPDGTYALEMEYVEGGTIGDVIRLRGKIPAEEALAVARDVASALAAAHEASVVHGDVKPGNVLVGKDGRVKLADFGLARLLAPTDLTRSRKGPVGTPQYMAPEVIGEGAISAASDVWGLGVLLYNLLTGRLPFAQRDIFGLFHAVQFEPVPPLGPEVPREVVAVVERCLAKEPGERFANGAELLAALEGRAVPAPAGGEGRRAPRGARRELERIEGRAAECARLGAAIERVARGNAEIVLVTGPAGIGKTTLVGAAAATAREQGWRTLTAAVTPVEGVVRPLFQAACALAGIAPAPASPAAEATFPNLERTLQSLARERPLVVVLEECHHASEEEMHQLARAYRRLAQVPILWLATERTSELGLSSSQLLRADPLLDVDVAERLDLGPLPSSAIYRLLDESAEGARFPGGLLERLARRSEGNPFVALQFFHHMREIGALRREQDQWVVADRPSATDAPPELRDLVARRLTGLPEATRTLLDVAAVDGLEFDGEALGAILELPLLAVLRQLQAIYRNHGLVVPRERGFRFGHPLLQEVIYAEVAPELRRATHRALAEHLESRAEAVDPERLGVHWEHSDDPARAAPHLLRAARRAANRLENYRCIDLATRAGVDPARLPPDLVRSDPDAVLQIANSLGELGRHAEREQVCAELLRIAHETGDAVLRLRVHARRGITRFLGTGLRPGDEEEIRAAARDLPDSVDQGIAFYVLGLMERARGHLRRAEAALHEADERFVRHHAWGRHGSVLDQLGTIAARAGETRRAAHLYAEAARVSHESGREANAAISEVNAITAEIDLGEIDGKAERLANAARLIEVDGLLGAAGRVRVVLAQVHFALGDLAAARRVAEEARAVLVKVGMLPGLVEVHGAGAYLAAAAGDLEHARAEHALALAAARKQGDARALTALRAQEALLAARAGDPAAAEVAAQQALSKAAAARDKGTRLDVALLLAEAALFGLPASVLAAARRLLPPAGEGEEDTAALRSARAWVDGMAARADPDAAPDTLEAQAAILAVPDAGMNRALLHAVADLLRAEASHRRGDAGGARDLLDRARTAAERLGYAWTPSLHEA